MRDRNLPTIRVLETEGVPDFFNAAVTLHGAERAIAISTQQDSKVILHFHSSLRTSLLAGRGAGQGACTEAAEGSAEEGGTLSHLSPDSGSLGGSQRRIHLL